MNEKQLRQFRNVASAIGPPGIFRSNGGSLPEFLKDYVRDTDTVKDVACKVFEYFCLTDGKFNNFLPGVRLAVGFLKEAGFAGGVENDQSLKDLRTVLSTGDIVAIRQWIESNYP